MAGASTTIVKARDYNEELGRFRYEITWLADDATGAVDPIDIPGVDAFLTLVVTDPGATAPTTLYDITLNDEYGVDVMGGALVDRSATATEQAMPLIAGCPVPRVVDGPLTFALTGNSINSAIGKCYVHFQK